MKLSLQLLTLLTATLFASEALGSCVKENRESSPPPPLVHARRPVNPDQR
jgi:hypothetical protein